MSLHVSGLGIRLPRTVGSGLFDAVQGFEIDARPGESVALVGASGSGKSLIAQALLGLLPPGAHLRAERMQIDGIEVDPVSPRDWSRVRGRRIAWIPQEAQASLDPLRSVGRQLREGLRFHGFDRIEERARDALREAGLSDPERLLRAYPHQLSGGMAQRVMLALAVALEPRVFVADEPTTALDLVIKAAVLSALQKRVEAGAVLVLVTHELAVARRFCGRVVVVYSGRAVETGQSSEVLHSPRHPYTRDLLDARFESQPADLEARPPGCPYHPECSRAVAPCRRESPPPTRQGDHLWTCHAPLEPPRAGP